MHRDRLSPETRVDQAFRTRLSRMGFAVLPNPSIGPVGEHRTLSLVVALREAAGQPLPDVAQTADWVQRHLGTRLDRMSSTWRAGIGSEHDLAALRSVVEAVVPDTTNHSPRICILMPQPDGRALLVDPLGPHGAPPMLAEDVGDDALVLVDWREGFEVVRNDTRGHGRESLSSLLMELGTTHDRARELTDQALIESGLALSTHTPAMKAEFETYLHQFAAPRRARDLVPLKSFVRRVIDHGIPTRFYPEVKQLGTTLPSDRIGAAIDELAGIDVPRKGSTASFIDERLKAAGYLAPKAYLRPLYALAIWLETQPPERGLPMLPELVESLRLARGDGRHSGARDRALAELVAANPTFREYLASPGRPDKSQRALVGLVAGHSTLSIKRKWKADDA